MRFENYFQPKTIEECCEILVEYGKDAVVVAGGTDIVPRLKNDIIKPKALISLQDIPDIDKAIVTDEGLILGSSATLRALSLNKEVAEKFDVVCKAAGHVSSMQVRNVATIGGNVCNASPSADALQGLIALKAICKIQGVNGKREVAIEDFFKGPGKTVLEAGEVLLGFFIPTPKENTKAVYKKFAIRGDTDITIVGASAAVTLAADGTIEDAVIGLAAVAATPLRAKATEEYLIGKKLTEEVALEAGKIAEANCSPISDQRATAAYRKEMVRVWVKNALIELM